MILFFLPEAEHARQDVQPDLKVSLDPFVCPSEAPVLAVGRVAQNVADDDMQRAREPRVGRRRHGAAEAVQGAPSPAGTTATPTTFLISISSASPFSIACALACAAAGAGSGGGSAAAAAAAAAAGRNDGCGVVGGRRHVCR